MIVSEENRREIASRRLVQPRQRGTGDVHRLRERAHRRIPIGHGVTPRAALGRGGIVLRA